MATGYTAFDICDYSRGLDGIQDCDGFPQKLGDERQSAKPDEESDYQAEFSLSPGDATIGLIYGFKFVDAAFQSERFRDF
jgi:hypothetical protein